jgi:hypothetical protein
MTRSDWRPLILLYGMMLVAIAGMWLYVDATLP